MKTSTDIVDDMTNLTEFSVVGRSDNRVVFSSHFSAIAYAFAAARNSVCGTISFEVQLTA